MHQKTGLEPTDSAEDITMSRNLLLWTTCLLAICAAFPALADHEAVTLYRDNDFRGQSETFTGDVPSLSGTRIGNDSVSSMQVAPGCEVTLYTDSEYRGRSQTFTGAVRDLGRTPVGNDSVSSLRVDCRSYDDGYGSGYDDDGYGGGPGGGRSGVTLYTGRSYRGDREVFYEDDPRLYNNDIGQDRARSVQVGTGCEVTLYEHPDYGGRSLNLTRDVRDLSQTRFGRAGVSSLRVNCRRGGGGNPPGGLNPPGSSPSRPGAPGQRRGVTLYHDDDFRGGSETFYEDRTDLGRSRIGNDNASSIRVDRGCRAVLYRDSNFRGEYEVITRDVSSLSRTRVGNDAVSSLKVECRGGRGYR